DIPGVAGRSAPGARGSTPQGDREMNPPRLAPGDVTASTGHGDVIRARGASVRFGERVLWSGVDLDIGPGTFTAILGPNGVGKSTLLKVMLGLQPLSAGTVSVLGTPAG